MKAMNILLSALAAASILMLTSCGDYVGKEKTHPLFMKAGNSKAAGNYQDSAKYFEEFLLICPKSAETHFQLASLYGDNLDEPLKSVYHYRKYMELNPKDTANAEDIRSFTELAKKRLYEKLKEEYKDTAAAAALTEDLEKTKERLTKYVEYSKALENQNQLMKQRLKEIATDRKGAVRPPKTAVADPIQPNVTEKKNAASSVAQITEANRKNAAGKKQDAVTEKKDSAPAASAGKLGTYKVQPGDTLVKISRKLYGSPKYYRLIADYNKDSIPANLQVRVGQVLKIPQLPASSR